MTKFTLKLLVDNFFVSVPVEYAGSQASTEEVEQAATELGEKLAPIFGGTYMYKEDHDPS